jgi:hypothetical protein
MTLLEKGEAFNPNLIKEFLDGIPTLKIRVF